MNRWIAACCLGIVAFDAVEAVMWKPTGAHWFTPYQFAVYFSIGYAAKRAGMKVFDAGVVVAATAFVDATIGSAVASSIAFGHFVSFDWLAGAFSLNALFEILIGGVGIGVGSIAGTKVPR
jgi:hypothetical protein